MMGGCAAFGWEGAVLTLIREIYIIQIVKRHAWRKK